MGLSCRIMSKLEIWMHMSLIFYQTSKSVHPLEPTVHPRSHRFGYLIPPTFRSQVIIWELLAGKIVFLPFCLYVVGIKMFSGMSPPRGNLVHLRADVCHAFPIFWQFFENIGFRCIQTTVFRIKLREEWFNLNQVDVQRQFTRGFLNNRKHVRFYESGTWGKTEHD